MNLCNRYLAEFKTGSERKDAAENTMVAYKAAQVIFFSCIAVLILNFVGWGIVFFIYPIYHSVYCVANSFLLNLSGYCPGRVGPHSSY